MWRRIKSVLFIWISTITLMGAQGNQYKPPSSNPQNLYHFKGALYFSANDGIRGDELWRMELSTKKLDLVADVTPGATGSSLEQFCGAGDNLWFCRFDKNGNGELWASDGLPNGRTNRIWAKKDVGHDEGVRQVVCNFGSRIIFAEGVKSSSRVLWISDGTSEGTFPLAVQDGSLRNSDLIGVGIHEGNIYFGARDLKAGPGLWRSDGTSDGAKFLYSFKKEPTDFVDLGNSGLLFVAETEEFGSELWITHGTTESTQLLKDIYNGPEFSSPGDMCLSALAESQGTKLVYFSATHPDTGRELWQSDGSPEGTVLVQDIAPGPFGSGPAIIRSSLRGLFLTAMTPELGKELWGAHVNGDHYGPLVQPGEGVEGPKSSEPYALCLEANGYLYYSQKCHDGEELWFTTGVPGSARQLSKIYTGGTAEPYHLTLAERVVYFSAADPVHGRELWETRGENGPPALVHDIFTDNSANPSSSPSEMEPLGDTLLFAADDIEHGNELWITDGTEVGTRLLRDISTGSTSSNPSHITAIGGVAYFCAETEAQGLELWVTNGTEIGTAIAADVNPHGDGSPENLVELNGKLFFTVFEPESGNELWSVEPGKPPRIHKNIRDGKDSSNPRNLVVWNNQLYFQANDGVHGEELWRTDGTEQGTVMVCDVVRAPYDSISISSLQPAGNALYIAGSSPTTGRELWLLKEDGMGIRLVRDIASPAQLDSRAGRP